MQNWLTKQADLFPERMALFYRGQSWTFAELKKEVEKICGHLASLEINSNKRVAILPGNTAASYMTILAIQQIGLQTGLLNFRLSNDELQSQLVDAGLQNVLIDDSLKSRFKEGQKLNVSCLFISELESLKIVPPQIVEDFPNQKIASIMYTSGTTGKAHGVLQTYGNHFYSAVGSAFNLGFDPEDQWLCVVPIFHISGFSIMMRSLVYGMGVVLLSHFDPENVTKLLSSHAISLVSVVPLMLKQLLRLYPKDGYQNSFRAFLLGGEPIDQNTLDICLRKGIKVIQSYGMTETCSQVVALNFQDAARKIGSVGKALFPVQLRIADDQTNEVQLKGSNLAKGYLNDDQRFKSKFTGDGWFKTGDVGLIDEEGFLFIKGRLDEMFISGGENIFPNEIENVYAKLTGIKEIGIIGISDRKWGKVPCAFIVPASSKLPDQEELLSYGRRHLAHYKVPKKFIFVDNLPHTASGKLQHSKLHTIYLENYNR